MGTLEAVFNFVSSLFQGLTREILAPFLRQILGLAIGSVIPACFAYLSEGALSFLVGALAGNTRSAMR